MRSSLPWRYSGSKKEPFWIQSQRPGTVAHACNLSTLGLRWVDYLRSGVRDQPCQHAETPSLLKIQKLARHDGARL